jgi:hypothetical protein
VISFHLRPTGTIVAAAVALGLLLAGIAQASASSKVIARGTLLKDGKTSYASGTLTSPKAISAKVTISPKQTVKISYSLTCSNGKAGGEDNYDPSTKVSSDTFAATAPLTKALKLPIAHPKTCTVTLYAQTMKKAKPTLLILSG